VKIVALSRLMQRQADFFVAHERLVSGLIVGAMVSSCQWSHRSRKGDPRIPEAAKSTMQEAPRHQWDVTFSHFFVRNRYR
jgi:hypothetical protein